MNKIIKQLERIYKGEEYITDKLKYTFILVSVGCVHVFIAVIFLMLNIYPMVIFNVCSILLYLIMLKTVTKGKFFLVFNLTYLEICLHSYFSGIMVGWDSGFQLYNLALIPVSFYVAYNLRRMRKRMLYPFFYSIVSMMLFLTCRVLLSFFDSVYHLQDQQIVLGLYLFNGVIAFLMLLIFSILFLMEINISQGRIEDKNRELDEAASIDPLTGLLNRRKMMTYMRRAKMSNECHSIILCDIDDFKKVNDNFGHDCGDCVLIKIANIIKDGVSLDSFVCRWGGEEILILCRGNLETANILAEKLRNDIEKTSINYYSATINATITLGVEEFSNNNSIDDVIIEADNKLYKGKHNGKNCVIS